MGGFIVFLLLIHCFFFSCIFWILTFVSKVFYKTVGKNYKLDFYECGFRRTSFLKINYAIQYVLLATFLILYDADILAMYPAFMDMLQITVAIVAFVAFFIFLLLGALVVDYLYSTLDWVL